MSNNEPLIQRFKGHKSVSESKFNFMLERQRGIENAMTELQEETSDFYSFVADSPREIDAEISVIKEKIKDL